MAKILFAWELGVGLGHVGRLRPLAAESMARGHEVLMQLSEWVLSAELLADLPCLRLAAPRWLIQVHGLPNPPVSLAEILLGHGYLQPRYLQAQVQGWLGAIALFKPDVLVADYAPTAVLAARIAGVPCASLGIGINLPPDVAPMPPIRSWEAPSAERLLRAEQQVHGVVDAVLKMHGRPPLERLSQLFHGDSPLLCTWPEFDPYPRNTESTPYWGPSMDSAATGTAVDWPAGEGPRVFAYLRLEHPDLLRWLDALLARDCRVICYCAEVAGGRPAPRKDPRLVFTAGPAHLPSLLNRCDALMCHAGESTTAQALLAGVPLILLPLQAEQFLRAQALQSHGLAINAAAHPRDMPLEPLLAQLLDSRAMQDAARAFAHRHAGFSPAQQTRDLVDRFEALAQPPAQAG